MKNDKILVSNIQRMCFQDGPGIRTTVFLKGCRFHCPWCANPENISFEQEEYVQKGQKGIYGKIYTEKELIEELLKDRVFWRKEGGVTFSGGEPLEYAQAIENVLKELKREGISIAFETTLGIDMSFWSNIKQYIDLYIIDLKILNKQESKRVTGIDIDIVLDNISKIVNNNNVIFRIPCNYEFTLFEENIRAINKLLDKYSDIPVEIFATHNLSIKKYESLNKKPKECENIIKEELEDISYKFRHNAQEISIISIV